MVLAVVLAATAGYVDAVGFLDLGGYFVSFMSGNTTRMGAEFTNGRLAGAGKALGLIGLFFVGCVLGGLLARFRDGRVAVLVATTLLVAAAGLADTQSWFPVPAALVATVGMGTMNATFLRGGEVAVPLTYVTGSVVKAGQRLADALLGGPRWEWVRPALIWAGLACGSVLGGWVYSTVGNLQSLWPAVLILVVTTSVTWWVRRQARSSTAG
ncbi:DUF1275 domain-containing protein [Gordonia sp. X0973]|uniref:YoaK family protein n=1 Tax=Gordonia sp. X0973 TaxID=2742602 RepID=UPI0013EB0C37|nr:YoaK family protein [Gordonia sp. X0973]QKT09092.1 DUF1275 domain-containing protein [Gordonia sp. X0973]